MKRIVILLCLGLAGVVSAVAIAGTKHKADNGSPATGHVFICHHTGASQAHEWVYIAPDASGVFAGHANPNHQDFFGPEDIIPAFVFVDAHGDSHSYAGQNLTTKYDANLEPAANGQFTGAQILAAHCVAPETPPTTTTAPKTTTTVEKTVTAPGATSTVEKTVTAPGAVQTVTAPGAAAPPPVTTTVVQTVTGPTTTATNTVTTPGKVKKVIVIKKVPAKLPHTARLSHTK